MHVFVYMCVHACGVFCVLCVCEMIESALYVQKSVFWHNHRSRTYNYVVRNSTVKEQFFLPSYALVTYMILSGSIS